MAEKQQSDFVYYKDPAGNSIKFCNYNGIPVPNIAGDMKTRLMKIPTLKVRPDDVYICGYVKVGTNWVWEITNMVLSGKAENVDRSKVTMMLEGRDTDDLDTAPSPRVMNTHFLLPDLPPDIIRKGARVIYIIRNPKDVCVSHFHHNLGLSKMYEYDGDWENYFQLWLNGHVDYGCYFAFLRHWEEQLKLHPDLKVHILHYEMLKLNFIQEAKRLAKFLGVLRTDEFYQKLAEKCDIQVMRAFKDKCYTPEQHAWWRTNKSNFFRKGIIGDWKNHFTVAQNEQFDAVIKQKLCGSDLKFIYEV